MKLTAQRACIAVYLLWVLTALTALVMAHGGLAGDVDPYVASIANPEAKNAHAPGVLFNRWKISYDQEPWIVRLLFITNAPAYALALLLYKILGVFPPFQELFPFGISYPSYPFVLMLALGFVQWMAVGALIDKWRTRNGGLGACLSRHARRMSQ
jgi:hypothetical protein